MSATAKTVLLAASAAWLALWTTAPAAAQSDEPTIPRVKPSASRSIKIEPNDPNNPGMRYYRGGGYAGPQYAVSADGKFIATQEGNGNQLAVWDLEAGKTEGGFAQVQQLMGLALSPDGKKMVTTGQQNGRNFSVQLWDTDKRKKVADLDEGVNYVNFTAAAFAPAGKTVALAGAFQRGGQPGAVSIHLWDVTSGEEVRKFDGPAAPPPQNRRMWRMTTVDCMTFAPDGKTLALVTDRKILLYEVATGRERALLATLPVGQANPQMMMYNNAGPDSVATNLAFSPDGRLLAAACNDGLVRLWDVVSGAELLPAMGHKNEVRAVVFTADGKSLMSFGQDNKLLTWSVADFRKSWTIDPAKMTTKVLTGLWDDLRGEDRPALSEALRLMAETPGPTVAFLREKVKPVPAVDSTRITELIGELRSDDFNVRKKAVVELRKFGDLALPAMREQQQKVGYDEVLQQVAQSIESKYPTPEQVQAGYAVEVLERIGNDDARKLLGELARGAAEASVTQKAVAVLDRLPKEKPAATGNVKLDALWQDLAAEDAPKAFRAVRALAARPTEAAPFLRDQLRPIATAEASDDPARIGKLITELDANDFETRESASKELAKLGGRAEAALKKALEGSPAPEAKRRIDALLAEIAKPKASAEQLQVGRALEALEKMGGGDARAALESIGKDAKNRAVKDAVADALKRVGQ
jgi:Anaphase-promoting complex subunit 4 WD40 domain